MSIEKHTFTCESREEFGAKDIVTMTHCSEGNVSTASIIEFIEKYLLAVGYPKDDEKWGLDELLESKKTDVYHESGTNVYKAQK